LVVALGRAAARVLGVGTSRFLVGRDTRISGPLLQGALSAGLAAEGADVVDLGVMPTPGVAWASVADKAPAAVISASHNAYPDNGIKFFGPGGRKLGDEEEARLEAELDRIVTTGGHLEGSPVVGAAVGRVEVASRADGYVGALLDALEGRSLPATLSVVIDGAHGAASVPAPEVLRRAGVRLHVLNASPDGVNINSGCGSTYPGGLQRAVVELGADVGLAFDGDADRVLAVDHRGELVDGDQIIAICALDRHGRGSLAGDTVVVTVMANLGFRKAMAAAGIRVVETAVGDRWILEEMESGGAVLGGEQSGHVIFRDLATTGDGILTGLQLLEVVARTGRPLAELAAVMTHSPQLLRNVRVAVRRPLEEVPELGAEVDAVAAELGDQGRVLVRPSGTESLVRVMVEALDAADAEAACDRLCAAVEKAFGTP